MEYTKRYLDWCENSYFDLKTREELQAICNQPEEIEDRFYKELEFGTGGLRGIIGAGTNRINIYTIRKATQGIANYIKKQPISPAKKTEHNHVKIAIAYDSRMMSKQFAEETACCFCANGIETYLFSQLTPTPLLSYAVRELNCIAGIVITASHNPAAYNGYKVYWEDGAQITAPRDSEIIEEVNQITNYNQIKQMTKQEAKQKGMYHKIEEQLNQTYLSTLTSYLLHPDIIKKQGKTLKIVYTPLHGTGSIPVQQILKKIGFEQVFVVKEQEQPDGTFPTVVSPNPEEKEAFKQALQLAYSVDADLVLATDPDADRLGVYIKDEKTKQYIALSGNMTGLLLCEYILSQKQRQGTLPDNGAIVTTIVSSNMAKKIAKRYGVHSIETLTGFKYIGEQIAQFEQEKKYTFLFGFEESYGYLIGTYARDKDAVSAAMMLCEAAAYYKEHQSSLLQQLQIMYDAYGFYKETLVTLTLKGIQGNAKIESILFLLRNHLPEQIGSYSVQYVYDYKQKQILQNGSIIASTTLPTSNVLYLELEREAFICVRPSGTEPKIKFYLGIKESSCEKAEAALNELKTSLMELIQEK